MRSPTIVAAIAITLGGTAFSMAQRNVQGAVELSNGTKVPQNPQPHKHAARADSQGCAYNEVEFRLKPTKSAKDFTPVVGAKIPKGVKAQSLPIGSIANTGTA